MKAFHLKLSRFPNPEFWIFTNLLTDQCFTKKKTSKEFEIWYWKFVKPSGEQFNNLMQFVFNIFLFRKQITIALNWYVHSNKIQNAYFYSKFKSNFISVDYEQNLFLLSIFRKTVWIWKCNTNLICFHISVPFKIHE